MDLPLTDGVGASADPIAEDAGRTELRRALRSMIERVSPPSRVRELDEEERFDDALHAALTDLGALGIGVEHAPEGGDLRDQLVVIEELAAGPTSMAAFMIGHYAIVQALARFGTTHQQHEILDGLVSGRLRGAFALSEPAGGTDVARVMSTRAEVTDDGFRITGQKMWTSGATMADWIIVLARTAPIERSAADGVTMLLVPAGAAGLEIRPIDTFGIHGLSTCEVFLDGVEVPAQALIGDLHRGMRQAFASVNREGLLAAAATLGVGRAALALAVEHARSREVFGKALGAMQVPQHWLVDGAVALESARSLMARAAEIEVAGGDAANLASMAKLVASEAAVDIALRGMQLMGGMGFTREVAMQRLFRDGRLWSFSPLTNEMVRNTLGQRLLGLPRSY